MSLRGLIITAFALVLFSAVFAGKGPKIVVKYVQSNGQAVDSLESIPDYVLTDSMFIQGDSVRLYDTISLGGAMAPDTASFPTADDDIKGPITYTAKDSIVYDVVNNKIYLYGSAVVDYQNINLQAAVIEFDWSSSTLSASGRMDSLGVVSGRPVFTQDGKKYDAGRIDYNFKTEKGKVYEVITEESGGYVHLEEGKKTINNEWYGKKVLYTTCSDPHPHFYIKAQKAKVVPNKIMATGPANLVIADVPTPLWVPFGLFPIKQGQRSGLIFPQYGASNSLGFFLKDGGYFWSINDYYTLAVTGEIYTQGSWGARTAFQYKKRYKFAGSLNFSYFRRRPTDPFLPTATATNDFKLNWNFRQDQKANPTVNFNASINASTSTYNQNNLVVNNDILNTQLTSSVLLAKNWRGSPFNLTVGMNHSQNLRTRRVNITLPTLSFGMSRLYPFQGKPGGKKPFYEKFAVKYDMQAKSILNTIDSTLFTKESLDKIRMGINHTVNMDMPMKLFKHFTITPNFRYNEKWYFQNIEKSWNPNTEIVLDGNGEPIDTLYPRVETDTMWGFFPAREYNTGVSLTTTLYGIFNFKGGKIKALKHTVTPRVAFVYRPDFGAEKYGYYKTVQVDTAGNTQEYSPFDIVSGVYGRPSKGELGKLNFSLANSFEMKVFNKKDTVNNERKIGILDRLNISSGYNFAVDTLQWDNLQISASTRITKNINVSVNSTFDPYTTDSLGRRINLTMWRSEGKLFRLKSASVSLTGSLSSNQFNNKPVKEDPLGTEFDPNEVNFIENNPEAFYDFNNPWSISFTYNFNLQKGISRFPDSIQTQQSVSLNADFNLTPKWKFAVNTGYDITNKELTLTRLNVIRDLHCWELSFNWTAFPVQYQNYAIQLNVKSPILQQLKLSKKKNYLDSTF